MIMKLLHCTVYKSHKTAQGYTQEEPAYQFTLVQMFPFGPWHHQDSGLKFNNLWGIKMRLGTYKATSGDTVFRIVVQ